jgi:hypothetical protein
MNADSDAVIARNAATRPSLFNPQFEISNLQSERPMTLLVSDFDFG